MLLVAGLLAVIAFQPVIVCVALRALEAELAVLRRRAARLVRLSVAVDDLHHETTHVVPAYRAAVTRARSLRRPDDGEGCPVDCTAYGQPWWR